MTDVGSSPADPPEALAKSLELMWGSKGLRRGAGRGSAS